jgi:hypothetical protein
LTEKETDKTPGRKGLKERGSRRIQHAVVATFCAPRSFERTYALTDNLSRKGLYIRTLDPPATGTEVRVELLDRYGDVLQLRGTVAWRHSPGAVGGTICHGFSTRIDSENSPKSDLEKFEAMYDSLLEKLVARPSRGKTVESIRPVQMGASSTVRRILAGKTTIH